jgi:hypothetical protein
MGSTVLKGQGGWSREALIALIALVVGFGLMPLLIFYAGITLLGRYEGGNAARIYEGVYHGLQLGSAASLIVVFGPYGLYLILKALRLWWRASARMA